MFRSSIFPITASLRWVIHQASCVVVVLSTVIIGVTLLFGIIVRHIWSGSFAWTAELPLILFPWLIMGGIVMAAVHNEHLGVDYVTLRLPHMLRKSVESAVLVIVVIVMLTIAAQAPSLLRFLQYQSTPILGWPASWAFYSVPIGSVAVALVAIIRLPEVLMEPANMNGIEEGSV